MDEGTKRGSETGGKKGKETGREGMKVGVEGDGPTESGHEGG